MKYKLLLTSAITLALNSGAYATNGYWSHGYGAKSKSIAGACVAMKLGTMCAASNPGSLVKVGNRINDDASAVGPPMGPTSIPPGEYESRNDFFLIPHFAYNRMLDDNSSLGIA